MEENIARKIGGREAVKSALIGLLTAYVFFGMLIFDSEQDILKIVFWIFDTDIWYHLLIGALGIVSMSYLFGRKAGLKILVDEENNFLVGIIYGFIVLTTGTIIGCTVGFLQEVFEDYTSIGNALIDYYFKPLGLVLVFGAVPVAIVGIWFGIRIDKEGKKMKQILSKEKSH